MKNTFIQNPNNKFLLNYPRMLRKTTSTGPYAPSSPEEEAANNIESTDMVTGRTEVDRVKAVIRKKMEGAVRKADIELIVGQHMDEKIDKHNKAPEAHLGRITQAEGGISDHEVRIKSAETKVASHERRIIKNEQDIESLRDVLGRAEREFTNLQDLLAQNTAKVQEIGNELKKIKEGDYGALTDEQKKKLKQFFIKLGITTIDFDSLTVDQKTKLNLIIDGRLRNEIEKLKNELKKGMLTEAEKNEILGKISALEAFRTSIDTKVDELFANTLAAIKHINERIDAIKTGGITDAEKEALKTDLRQYIDNEITLIKNTLKDPRFSDEDAAKLKNALAELEGIKNILAEHGTSISEINTDVDNLNRQLRALNDLLKDLNLDELKALPQRVNEVEYSLGSMQTTTEKFRKDIEDLTASNADLHDQTTNLQSVQASMNGRLKALEGLRTKIEELLKMKEEVEKVNKFITKVEQLELRLINSEQQINALQLSDEEKQKKITAMQKDIAELNALKERIKEIGNLAKRVTDLEKLKTQVDKMIQDINNAQGDIQTLQQSDEQKSTDIEEMKNRLDALEQLKKQVAEIGPLMNDLNSLTRSFESINTKLRDLSADNEQVKSAIKKLQNVSAKVEDLIRTQDVITRLQKDIENFQQADIDRYKNEIAALSTGLHDMNEHILSLEEDVNGLSDSDNELRKSIQRTRNAIINSSERIDAMLAQLNKLKSPGAEPEAPVNVPVQKPEDMPEIDSSAEKAYNKALAHEDQRGTASDMDTANEALETPRQTGKTARERIKEMRKRQNET